MLICSFIFFDQTMLICSTYAFSCILVNNLISVQFVPTCMPMCGDTLSHTVYEIDMYYSLCWKYNLGQLCLRKATNMI
jgi:hypothetical protein